MKAHRTDNVSLTFGVIFLFLVGWWVTAQFVRLALPAVGWLVAVALILFGVFGLVGAFRSGRGAVPAPTSGVPVSGAGTDTGGVPVGMHADIIRELMEGKPVPPEVARAEAPAPAPARAASPEPPPSPYVAEYLTVPEKPGAERPGADATDEAEPAIDRTTPLPADPREAQQVDPAAADTQRVDPAAADIQQVSPAATETGQVSPAVEQTREFGVADEETRDLGIAEKPRSGGDDDRR